MGTAPKNKIVALTPYINYNHFYNKYNFRSDLQIIESVIRNNEKDCSTVMHNN